MAARTNRTHAVLGILAALALVGTVAMTGNGTSAGPADTQVISTSRLATAAPPSAPNGTSPSAPDPAPAPATAAAETPVARPTPLPAAAATWTVTTVVDGDTIWVSRDGISRKIRFIGIDTPETGQCGFAEARAALQRAIGGQHVTLTAGARDELDRYGRLLRYVDLDGVDSGLRLIQQGYAAARYDSRDGYGRHPRESSYVQADAASPRAACAASAATTSGGSGSRATTSAPVRTPTPVEAPTSGPAGRSTSGWPLAGDRHPCPRSAPVKGNESSMIAHSPGQQSYLVTNPERCFSALSQATAAGYRPAKR